MNRRTFIRTAAVTSIVLSPAGTLNALEADNAYRKNIGIQLYTLRNDLGKDTAGTLKQVAGSGYKQVELYGFPNADPMISGAGEAGLGIHSAHFEWDAVVHPKDAFQELGNGIIPMEPILVAAKAAGVEYCHVEQDQSPDPLASIKQSMDYLSRL